MAILPPETYSRIEITCVGGAITTRSVLRRTSPAGFVDQVDDIGEATSVPSSGPIVESDAVNKLAACVAWQNVANADPSATFSRFELVCSFEAVTIVSVSQVGSEQIATNETEITSEGGGPFSLVDAVALLADAHQRVVTAKGL